MWKIIKSEIQYKWYLFATLGLLLLVYTLFALLNYQLLEGAEWEIDYWGGLYSLAIYVFLFLTWGIRIKENRVRCFAVLPIIQKKNALARFWIAAIPFIAIIAYLIFIHLIFIDVWHNETSSLIGQIGVTLILFSAYLKTRDDWSSYWNFGKRIRTAFVTVLMIQVFVVFIFLEMDSFNKGLMGLWGPEAFHYAKLIFPLLGFIILISTAFSFRKRRTYLS